MSTVVPEVADFRALLAEELDPALFFTRFLGPDFKPNPFQTDLSRVLTLPIGAGGHTGAQVVALRQSGKSLSATVEIAHKILAGKKALIFGRNHYQALLVLKELRTRCNLAAERIPGLRPTNKAVTELEVASGGSAVALPSDPSSARGHGEGLALVWIDEMGFVRDDRLEALLGGAIFPMAVAQPDCRIVCTTSAGRRGGVAWKYWVGELGGDQWWKREVFRDEAKHISEANMDLLMSRLTEAQRSQEIENVWADPEGNTVWSPEEVQRLLYGAAPEVDRDLLAAARMDPDELAEYESTDSGLFLPPNLVSSAPAPALDFLPSMNELLTFDETSNW